MAGVGDSALLQIGAGQQLSRPAGIGDFTKVTINSDAANIPNKADVGDINKDGIDDVIAHSAANTFTIYLGQANGSYTSSGVSIFSGSTLTDAMLGDINGDGNLDVVANCSGYLQLYLGNGSSVYTIFASQTNLNGRTNLFVSDLENDGKAEVLAWNGTGYDVYGSSAGGTLSRLSSGALSSLNDLKVGDVNGDGQQDLITQVATSGFRTYLNRGGGAFELGASGSIVNVFSGKAVAGDFNNDGCVDLIQRKTDSSYSLLLDLKNGFTETPLTITPNYNDTYALDYDGDGDLDLLETEVGTGIVPLRLMRNDGGGNFSGGAISSLTFTASMMTVRAANINRDGVTDLVVSDSAGTYALTQKTVMVAETKRYNLNSVSGARAALDELRSQQERISGELGNLGAYQKRLDAAASTLSTMSDELAASASRISNVDVAAESAALARTQILQQSATAVLAQANQAPAIALDLLRGGG